MESDEIQQSRRNDEIEDDKFHGTSFENDDGLDSIEDGSFYVRRDHTKGIWISKRGKSIKSKKKKSMC